jgi:hypothetical protein
MELKKLTKEEKCILSKVMQKISKDPENNLIEPFFLRFKKYNFDFDNFISMHRETDTPLPSINEFAVKALRIPYEDLPLYINPNQEKGDAYDLQGKVVRARLKIGE